MAFSLYLSSACCVCSVSVKWYIIFTVGSARCCIAFSCVCLTKVLVGCCVELIEESLFMQGLLLETHVWNRMLRPMK